MTEAVIARAKKDVENARWALRAPRNHPAARCIPETVRDRPMQAAEDGAREDWQAITRKPRKQPRDRDLSAPALRVR